MTQIILGDKGEYGNGREGNKQPLLVYECIGGTQFFMKEH